MGEATADGGGGGGAAADGAAADGAAADGAAADVGGAAGDGVGGETADSLDSGFGDMTLGGKKLFDNSEIVAGAGAAFAAQPEMKKLLEGPVHAALRRDLRKVLELLGFTEFKSSAQVRSGFARAVKHGGRALAVERWRSRLTTTPLPTPPPSTESQEAACIAVALQYDVLVHMVTGGGKTLIMIIATEYRRRLCQEEGLVLVVAPLVALIRDLFKRLTETVGDLGGQGGGGGVAESAPSVVCIDHLTTSVDMRNILRRVSTRDAGLAYLIVSPCQMMREDLNNALCNSSLWLTVRCAQILHYSASQSASQSTPPKPSTHLTHQPHSPTQLTHPPNPPKRHSTRRSSTSATPCSTGRSSTRPCATSASGAPWWPPRSKRSPTGRCDTCCSLPRPARRAPSRCLSSSASIQVRGAQARVQGSRDLSLG
jgi:hypothetical protein